MWLVSNQMQSTSALYWAAFKCCNMIGQQLNDSGQLQSIINKKKKKQYWNAPVWLVSSEMLQCDWAALTFYHNSGIVLTTAT